MKKGDLVKVRFRNESWNYIPQYGSVKTLEEDEWRWGQVVDYRPDVLGGSSMYTANGSPTKGFSDIRGEVLVTVFEDGGVSWWDEDNVMLIGQDSQCETDANTME
jgi:hypothetical protein